MPIWMATHASLDGCTCQSPGPPNVAFPWLYPSVPSTGSVNPHSAAGVWEETGSGFGRRCRIRCPSSVPHRHHQTLCTCAIACMHVFLRAHVSVRVLAWPTFAWAPVSVCVPAPGMVLAPCSTFGFCLSTVKLALPFSSSYAFGHQHIGLTLRSGSRMHAHTHSRTHIRIRMRVCIVFAYTDLCTGAYLCFVQRDHRCAGRAAARGRTSKFRPCSISARPLLSSTAPTYTISSLCLTVLID